MSEQFSGEVDVFGEVKIFKVLEPGPQPPPRVRIHLDGNTSDVKLGGDGTSGSVSVRNPLGQESIRLDAGHITLGTRGSPGEIRVKNRDGKEAISLIGAQNSVLARNEDEQITVHVDGRSGDIFLGGNGADGDLIVRDNEGREVFHLNGNNAFLRVGTTGNEGDISVRDANDNEVLQFDGQYAVLRIGNTDNEGDLIVRDNEGREVFHLDGNNAFLRIGTTGNEGDISVRDANDREVFQFDAQYAVLRVGAAGNEGDIIVRDDDGDEVIHLNGGTGDIILRNADAAEQFDLADAVSVVPGTLMVLNHEMKLEPSSLSYDRKVVGVVAGAGKHRPGILLGHKPGGAARVPISVLGKVSCKADATYGSIELGDLLTTSPTPGHAMKANDPQRAFGAVIGKALSCLKEGAGLVDVLITLQ
jgi:hypothetical protein